MQRKLPFEVRARLVADDAILVIAGRGGEELAVARIKIGSTLQRRKIATDWAGDERLVGGEPIDEGDVLAAIEAAEMSGLHAAEGLERREDEAEPDDNKGRGESQANKLLGLVEKTGAIPFHDQSGVAWITTPVGNHAEVYRLESKQGRRWLGGLFYRVEGVAIGSTGLNDAVATLSARAIHDGPEHEVHVRLAEHDGNIFLDLGDNAWRAVRTARDGWGVVEDPQAKFTRSTGLRPLPAPVKGGKIEELRNFINVESDSDFILVVSWLIAALCPRGPFPVLSVIGEQGSAKSFTCRILRQLLDPNKADTRSLPNDSRDLMISANNSWVMVFDNLRQIPPGTCDALCRLSTGGGFATRELYSDQDELILNAMRPILLNGIGETSEAADLNDRRIVVSLPRIEETGRKTEASIWAQFEEARPRILGALLDAVAVGLKNIDSVKLDRLPRMADFALWVTACEPGLPWEPGSFMRAYDGCRADVHEVNMEACPVGTALREWIAVRGGWTGRASELLELLNATVGDDVKRRRGWPKAANSLSNALRRIAPTLRAVGVPIDFDLRNPKGNAKFIAIGTDVATVPIVQTDRIVQREEAKNGRHDTDNGGPDALYDLYDQKPIPLAEGETAPDNPFPDEGVGS